MPSQSPGTTDRKGGDAVTLSRIEVSAYRHPISAPVTTSFGTMRDRPAVFVRLEDGDGAFGWGEIFANWPVAGAEHRARLLMEDIADLVLGMEVSAPGDLFHRLTKATRIRALQCGEWGPFRQVIAGLDTALHDLLARRAGLPVCAYLGGDALDAVPVYASGIDVRRAEPAIETARAAGMRNFKVKIGFDIADDARRVRSLAGGLAPLETLLTDANQAWTLSTASDFLHRVDGVPLGWLEEPIAADAPAADWLALSRESAVPLAGGENIAGEGDFGAATRLGALTIFQPDIAKWGGFTGCLTVARAARAAGHRYCPHFLGGGIGLTASAHLLAAVGGDGLLEVDVNANPLRDLLLPPGAMQGDGFWHPGNAPGLGIEAMPEEIASLRTYTASRHVQERPALPSSNEPAAPFDRAVQAS